MRVPYLLIDGYNLMYAAGLARETYGPGDLKRCRERLLRHVALGLTETQRARTTVIFDAAEPPPGQPRESHVTGMKVVFAGPGQDADSVIESLIASHSSPRQLCVVSSDRRLQRSAAHRRGRFLTSDDFLDKLRRNQEQQPRQDMTEEQRLKAGQETPEADVQEWLDIFGDIPETRQLATEEDQWQRRIAELDNEEEGDVDTDDDAAPTG